MRNSSLIIMGYKRCQISKFIGLIKHLRSNIHNINGKHVKFINNQQLLVTLMLTCFNHLSQLSAYVLCMKAIIKKSPHNPSITNETPKSPLSNNCFYPSLISTMTSSYILYIQNYNIHPISIAIISST